MKADSIVIIPTYNEKENIEKIIRRVLSYEKQFDILVVDDNSPDGTAAIVKGLQAEIPERIYLLERQEKQGLGVAYIAGFRWCLDHGYEYLFEMDADFSHNPDDLIRLYQACVDGADAAVGSRYVSLFRRGHFPLTKGIFFCYNHPIGEIFPKNFPKARICYDQPLCPAHRLLLQLLPSH